MSRAHRIEFTVRRIPAVGYVPLIYTRDLFEMGWDPPEKIYEGQPCETFAEAHADLVRAWGGEDLWGPEPEGKLPADEQCDTERQLRGI